MRGKHWALCRKNFMDGPAQRNIDMTNSTEYYQLGINTEYIQREFERFLFVVVGGEEQYNIHSTGAR